MVTKFTTPGGKPATDCARVDLFWFAVHPDDGLLRVVEENQISMCGAVATAVMMHACIEMGCAELTVVEHTDSGDTSGDLDYVVGYASGYVV